MNKKNLFTQAKTTMLAILLFACSFTVLPAVSAMAATDKPISLHKPVTASSYVEPYSPDRVVDGSIDPADRWYSCGEEETRWLQIDLEDNYTINRYVLKHMGAAGWNLDCHAADFRLEYSVNGEDNWITVDDTDDNIDAVTDRNVNPFTARHVRMCFDQGNQTNDLWVSVMDWEIYGVLAAPTAPTSLKAIPSDRQIAISWMGSGKAKTSYEIYMSNISGGPYDTLVKKNIKKESFIIKELENNLPYFFVVKAENTAGESDYSEEVSATPVPDIKSLKVTPPTKLTYQIGEKLDLTGMAATAVYSDSSKKDVTADVVIRGFSSEKAGLKKITVSYEGKRTSFRVRILK